MLRESNFEDGKTFINGFLERSLLLSYDKLAELDVIVDDDEGWDCVTIIFGIAGFSQLVGVGVREATLSGDGDRVRQFFNHKSGVIKVSKKGKKCGKLISWLMVQNVFLSENEFNWGLYKSDAYGFWRK